MRIQISKKRAKARLNGPCGKLDTVDQYGGLSRMVNRNDDAVAAVFVGGCSVFLNGEPTAVLGSQRTGSFLRANTRTTAARRAAAEPVSAAT